MSSSIFSHLLVRLKYVSLQNTKIDRRFYFASIFPIGVAGALTLAFGNIVYLHLSVSFIQMLKAFTPVMTMLLLFSFRMETVSFPMILAVSTLSLGTAISSFGEVIVRSLCERDSAFVS